jgi:uncharacterized protein
MATRQLRARHYLYCYSNFARGAERYGGTIVAATIAHHCTILKFTRDPIAANNVRKIERNSLQVGDKVYTGNIGLLANTVIDHWPDRPVAELDIDYLSPILGHSPELVILGGGWHYTFAPRELTFTLARRGIGLEVMDTPAACRTFNILINEGRLPAAILYIGD